MFLLFYLKNDYYFYFANLLKISNLMLFFVKTNKQLI